MNFIRSNGVLIFSFLGFIILATAVTLGTIILFFITQLLLSGEKNYLLFVSNSWNIITIGMLEFLFFYFLISIKDKFIKGMILREDKNIIRRFQRVPKIYKIAYLAVLAVITYCGITSYTVLYENSVKVSSPLNPIGVTYMYNDIKSVEIGVRRVYKDYTPYYRVKFNNDKTINLFSGTMDQEKGRTFEDILIDLDKELKAQGVSKNVNKKNFEKYSKGLDKEFVNKIEELFE